MTFQVVCINASATSLNPRGQWPAGEALVEGRIYTVVDIWYATRDGGSWDIYYLAECPRQGTYNQPGTPAHGMLKGHASCRFRRVRETSIEQFRSLLKPTPELLNV